MHYIAFSKNKILLVWIEITIFKHYLFHKISLVELKYDILKQIK